MATAVNMRCALWRREKMHVRALGIAIVFLVVVPVALAISAPRPASNLAPGEVVDRFLLAGRAHDVDAATAILESDVTISDSGGKVSRGGDVARRFIDEYGG